MNFIRTMTGAVFVALLFLGIGAAPASATHYGYEWNIGTKSGPSSYDQCAYGYYANVCYQKYGDVWWVYDKRSDGRSAVADWYNETSSGHVRRGSCRNTSGAGTWVKCNKDYSEGSYLSVQACGFNGSSGTWGSYKNYFNYLSCDTGITVSGGA